VSDRVKHPLLRDERVIEWLTATLRKRFDPEEPELLFPERGARTPVAIARWSGRSVIAKLFSEPTRFVSSTFHLRYMRERALPVPALLAWSLRSRFEAPRSFLSVEEFLPGRALEDLPEPDRAKGLVAVAQTLARLHSVRRRSHGRVAVPRPGSYAAFYLRIARARIARLEGAIPTETVARLGDALAAAARAIPARRSHALIHAHVNMGNFLVANEAWLIDVGSAHYGDPARDLVRGVHRLCRGPEEAARFLDAYFGAAQGAERGHFEAAEPFYACDYVLRKTRKLADRGSRDGAAADAIRERVEKTVRLCHELLRPGGPRFHELFPDVS
jgi:aminoglycoside phosphotransferase (APT) family kinase protein